MLKHIDQRLYNDVIQIITIPFELIDVNNNSTYNIWLIKQKWMKDYPHIIFEFNKTNCGESSVRNFVLNIVEDNNIAFVNCND